MSLWKIAWRSIQQRFLASTLTALSMALGVALVIAVLVIYGVVRDSFSRAAQGYNIIVGAKGGKLQLVLNTVYHLSTPIENIPWWYYKQFTSGKYKSQVDLAIPLCLGDNYQGYRVVGTTPRMFSDLEYAPGQKYSFSAGNNFKHSDYFGAVIGSLVARKTGLAVGSEFQPTHGVDSAEHQGHKHDAFHVVGVLAPTGTPNDRALFINLEGFFMLEGHAKPEEKPAAAAAKAEPHDHGDHDHHHDGADHDHATEPAKAATSASPEPSPGPAAADQHEPGETDHKHDHDHPRQGEADHEHMHEHDHGHGHDHAHDHGHGHHHHHEPLPESQREVTAILIRTHNDIQGMSLMRRVNKEVFAQAVMPAFEIQSLFVGIVGNIEWLLLALAALVVVVAGIGILVSIYNSMNDRRHDIAVMRALGARRTTVMSIILLESILLAVGGGLAGILLGHGLIQLLNPVIVAQTGVTIGLFRFEAAEAILIPVLVVLAALVGFLPSLAAYRTDVAKALSDRP